MSLNHEIIDGGPSLSPIGWSKKSARTSLGGTRQTLGRCRLRLCRTMWSIGKELPKSVRSVPKLLSVSMRQPPRRWRRWEPI